MNKVALITGVTGQDGFYLTKLLLDKGYTVHGIRRRVSTINTRITDRMMQLDESAQGKFKLHYGDLSDTSSINRIIQNYWPDEIYNLAAQSHVDVSFENPYYTGEVDALAVTSILESIRNQNYKKIK